MSTIREIASVPKPERVRMIRLTQRLLLEGSMAEVAPRGICRSATRQADARPRRSLMRHADVIVAAPRSDPHGEQVLGVLHGFGADAIQLTADDLVDSAMDWRVGGRLVLEAMGSQWLIDDRTTVWWRRPGSATAPSLNLLEQRLVADEVAVLLPGALEAAGVRWVDSPWAMWRARLKLLQLAVATRLQVRVPETLVAGSVRAAQDFAQSGPIVAKAASSGVGIAPFVGLVPREELARVEACPTLLQQFIESGADARIVTIRDARFAWLRHRASGEQIDWRTEDPAGRGFLSVDSDPSHGQANTIAEALGLTFSVQDWLVTKEGPVFLEVNAQGQWLFLRNADSIVVTALASHLLGGSD